MDSVKRRLVYVADDDEAMLNDLTGTPPTRQSRLSRLHIASSSGSKRDSTGNRPSRASLKAPFTPIVVSFDGFLLADGNGGLHPPRNTQEAERIYNGLRECRQFLRDYLDASRKSSDTSPSSRDVASSSDYEEEEGEDESSHSSTSAGSTRKRPRREAQGGITVAELREQLRSRGLPLAGRKDVLIARLKFFEEEEAQKNCDVASPSPAQPPMTTTATMLAPPQGDSVSPSERKSSSMSDSKGHSPRMSTTSSEFQSPKSRASNCSSSRGLWGAIVNVGSLFFRPNSATPIRRDASLTS